MMSKFSDRYTPYHQEQFSTMIAKAETGELQYDRVKKLGGLSVNPHFFNEPDIANAVSAFVHPLLSVAKAQEALTIADLVPHIKRGMPRNHNETLIRSIEYALNMSLITGFMESEESAGIDKATYRLTKHGERLDPYEVQLVPDMMNQQVFAGAQLGLGVGGGAAGWLLGAPSLLSEIGVGLAGFVGGMGFTVLGLDYTRQLQYGHQAYAMSRAWE